MERETLDVDVLVVGAGPAGLSAGLRLSQLQAAKGGDPLSVAVVDKAREAGAHSLSGALLDPSTLTDLIPDFAAKGAPLACEVTADSVYFLTPDAKVRLPITPPPFRNHGNYVISLNQFVKWLAGQVEAAGTDLFMGFAAQSVLFEGRRVVGVRTGDRGLGRHGTPRGPLEPGADIRAKVTIFADGVRGHLTKQVLRTLQLAGHQPAQYAIGLKELWDLPADRLAPGTVIHTLGYPLRQEEFGGSWIYALPEGRVSLGLVVGLDYVDPLFDPHAALQRLKQHPFVRELLQGGQLVRFGAKALPEGGWNTQPTLYADGALIAGDAANFVNSLRLKGIHLAMRSGMLAAETAFDAVRAGDTSSARLRRYKAAVDASAIRTELYPVRNIHQAFAAGTFGGSAFAALAMATNGWWPGELEGHTGHTQMATLDTYYGLKKRDILGASNAVAPDRVLTFDKATSVHHSGTHHEENQPVHLLVQTDVCHSVCGPEYGHPCVRFCPANVYEIVDDGAGGRRLQINASNCVHCKTCDIMDPYGVITWVAPEGGEGPQYRRHVSDQADPDSRPGAEWRRSWSKRVQVAAIAGLGAPLLRLLARTWRVEVVGAEHVAAATGGGPDRCIYAIWHGRILPCMWCWRDHGIVVVTSENFDGEWIARIIQRFGFGVARGSSTRGGSRALRELLRTLRHAPAGFTVDGPRGPRGVVQPGVAWLARATGHPIVCLNTEAERSWTVRSWDRAQIPKPFTRVVATISPAIRVPADADAARLEAIRLEVAAALAEAARAGQRALGRAEVAS